MSTLHEEFKTKGYAVIKNAVKEQTRDVLASAFRMFRFNMYYENNVPLANTKAFEDSQVPYSFPWYGFFPFESLMVNLKPEVEKITGRTLHPCYTYARIMHGGASMAKHKDRPSCEFSATICLDYDKKDPYPIFIEDYAGNVSEVVLKPGDMIVYNGTELNHWRDIYTGQEHIQVFVHYVDANGPYADHIYDHRPMLGLPSSSKPF